MKDQIYLYAIVKSLYEQGEDYIDSFRPFVIKAFPAIGKLVNLNFIQRSLEKDFSLKIPQHTLTTILKRAKRKHYVKQDKEKYMLTIEGQKYLDSLEIDNAAQRRLNELLEDLKIFLDEQLGTPLSIDKTSDMFLSFIHKNFESITECFISPTISDETRTLRLTTPEKHILMYIEIAEQQKPEIYKTLKDVVLGSIISSALSFEEFDVEREFKDCQIFFDSNLIFFILDLYYSEFNKPSIELLRLLKQQGFKLKVFDFTVDEMCRLINGYIQNFYYISSTVKVDTIYYRLKKLGWTKDDARKFIETIIDKISNLGIQIEWGDDVDLQHYKPAKDEYRSLIEEYKPYQPLPSQNHDLAAIEKIRELRKHPVRKIEDSKVFFLTSDHKLCKFNFFGMGIKIMERYVRLF